MELMERIYGVLVVSASEKFNETIQKLLPKNRYNPVIVVCDAGEAHRIMLERSFDIVMINSPLPDEFGTRLASDVCGQSGAGVMLLVKAEHYEDISARLTPMGIFTISKPAYAQFILQSMQLLCGTRERLRMMEKKAATFEEKMSEIRIVNRAKLLLISEKNLTETQAHRYIEKQAMDRCMTKKAIAEEIINECSA